VTPGDVEGELLDGWDVTADFGVATALPNSVVEVVVIGWPCRPGAEWSPVPALVDVGDDAALEPQPAAISSSTPSGPLINHRELRVDRRADRLDCLGIDIPNLSPELMQRTLSARPSGTTSGERDLFKRWARRLPNPHDSARAQTREIREFPCRWDEAVAAESVIRVV
jgi:hypothetical protein